MKAVDARAYYASLYGCEENEVEVDHKKWGIEYLICRQPHACKIMTLIPGQQVSMHWHKNKSETFMLVKGVMTVETVSQRGKRTIINLTTPLSSVTIDRMVPHTFYCPDGQEDETIFIEASTEDAPYDSYRMFPSGKRGEALNNW